jgi:hypothetical protein
MVVGEDQSIQTGGAQGLQIVGGNIAGIVAAVSATIYQNRMAPGIKQSR